MHGIGKFAITVENEFEIILIREKRMATDITFDHITLLVETIASQLQSTDFIPTLVVGIARGGLIPGVMLSHYFDCGFTSLTPTKTEYVDPLCDCDEIYQIISSAPGSRIVIVDEICDTGSTFVKLQKCFDTIPNLNLSRIKTASLQMRYNSIYIPDYIGEVINNAEWQKYPWELTNERK